MALRSETYLPNSIMNVLN